MIVVDTNVVFELMRPSPSAAVTEWVRARIRAELSTTSITLATRNLKDFSHTDVNLVDPWQHS